MPQIFAEKTFRTEKAEQSGLLGPNPTGLIGMSFFIIVALVMLAKMNVKCCNID